MNTPMHSSRLAPLKMLADRAESQAARAFGGAQQALQAADAQLRELERYQGGMSFGPSAAQMPGLMVNHEQFRARLGGAIIFQQQSIEKLRKRVEQARSAWTAARESLSRVERLVERSLSSERMTEDYRQQREYDELAQRLHAAGPLVSEI